MHFKKGDIMRILIVEDDVDLCSAITYHLEKEGYEADVCHNGGDALYYIKQNAYQLILLDRMLPEQSGLDILTHMRSIGMQTPVIITTALNGLGDRITGLDAGADDYLVKPYDMAELLARIRAVSRRPVQLESRFIEFADLSLDSANATLTGPSGSCVLSKREADLIELLIKNPGRVLARATIFARVWGADAPVEDGNLDNYIHFLRRRLRHVGSQSVIQTARGVGYALQIKE